MKSLNEIISQFPEVGKVEEIIPLTAGLINQTYKVKTADPQACDYILQCINHQVFKDVELLQHNIDCVTRHIREKLEKAHETDIDRKVLRFVPAVGGKTYYFDGEHYWRMCVFIPDSQSLEAVTPESSYLVGVKFGEFEAMLADLPEKLGETIPDFHNMEFRMKQLREAVAQNAAGRLERYSRWWTISKRMPTRCARLNVCIAKESFRNASATAIRRYRTCCSTKTATCCVSSTSILPCRALCSPISAISCVRLPIRHPKTNPT